MCFTICTMKMYTRENRFECSLLSFHPLKCTRVSGRRVGHKKPRGDVQSSNGNSLPPSVCLSVPIDKKKSSQARKPELMQQ